MSGAGALVGKALGKGPSRRGWNRAGLAVLAVASAVPSCAPAQTGTGVDGRSARPGASAPALVFDGVTVVDVAQGKLLPAQRVVVAGNRIRALGAAGAIKLPQGARVVDARGKYLIPGLWDMHVHPDGERGEYKEWASWLFLAHGVLGTRDAGSGVPLATFGQLKREIAAGTRVGPRLLVSGPQLNPQCTGASVAPQGLCIGPTTPEQVRRAVDSLHAAGADMIKHYGIPPDLFYAAAREARRVGIPLDGHPPTGISVMEASDSGQRIMDHSQTIKGICAPTLEYLAVQQPGSGGTLEQCRVVAARFRRNGTWVQVGPIGPFMGIWPARLADADIVARFRYLPAAFRPDTFPLPILRQSIPSNALAIVQQADLPILQSSDVGPRSAASWRRFASREFSLLRWNITGMPGASFQDEVIVAVEHGLTPLRALQSATLYPAQALGLADSLGTVAAGKLADLVLLDGDPLADIYHLQKVRAVVANGRYFDRAALDALLARAGRYPEP